jgi:hypothetical protein
VKSAEHLAALWIEGSKNYKDREGKLSGNVNITNNSHSSKLDGSPAICSDSKLTGMPLIKILRKVERFHS